MSKTAKQIQSDVIALLEGSDLAKLITGQVYRGTPESSYRPRDSRLEDIVVIFTEGNVDQIQRGVVTLNIYVPDIAPYDNGVLVEDGRRTDEIEAAASQWVDSLTCDRTDYRFRLRRAIHTQYRPEINQHFVVVRLEYEYFNQ